MSLRVIPSIDLRQGRCVRLRQGRFDRMTSYEPTPLEIAEAYAAVGAAQIHVVDLDGCLEGEPRNLPTIEALAAIPGVMVQLGGGLRTRDAIERCFSAGVGRVVLGSQAFEEPGTCSEWLTRYGPDRVVVAADVRIVDGAPQPAVHGWKEAADRSLTEVLELLVDHGLATLLSTDIARDGMMAGPNVELYSALVDRWPTLSIQASGGVRSVADLFALQATGAHAAIVGRSLLDGTLAVEEIEPWLRPAA